MSASVLEDFYQWLDAKQPTVTSPREQVETPKTTDIEAPKIEPLKDVWLAKMPPPPPDDICDKLCQALNAKDVQLAIEILSKYYNTESPKVFVDDDIVAEYDKRFRQVPVQGVYLRRNKVIIIKTTAEPSTPLHEYLHFLRHAALGIEDEEEQAERFAKTILQRGNGVKQ